MQNIKAGYSHSVNALIVSAMTTYNIWFADNWQSDLRIIYQQL